MKDKTKDPAAPTDPLAKYKDKPNVEVRDPHSGRFVKNNPGGPGVAILSKDRVRYHTILRDCTTDEEFKKVAAKLLQRAQAGESWAVRELLDRLMGKPKQVAEVDVRQTHVDPQQVINNIAVILGLESDDPDHIELEQKQLENKDD